MYGAGGRVGGPAPSTYSFPMARPRSTTTTRWTGAVAVTAGGLLLSACGGGPAAAPTTGSVAHTTVAAPGALRYAAPDPVARGTALVAVSCTAERACFALDPAGRAYRLTGGAWRGPTNIHATHAQPGNPTISCSDAPVCVAAPTGGTAVWDGRRWTAPRSADNTAVAAVGCAPTGVCVAVDTSGATFDYHGVWHSSAADGRSVSAVSCASAAFCVSVATAISMWDGRRWRSTETPPVTSAFTAVSCPTTTFCMAVDRLGQALRWNGRTWSAPDAVDPNGLHGAALTAVSCPTATLCVAADDAGTVLTWSGEGWTPTDVDSDLPLTGLSCPTPTYCVAVDRDGHAVIGRAG